MFVLWVIAVSSRLSISAADVLVACTSWETNVNGGTYTDCTFRDLSVQNNPIALLTLTRCNFINCGSGSDGGLVKVNAEVNVVVDGCTFLGCRGAYGGVFRLDGEGGLQLTNTVAEYCWGSGNGGFTNVNLGYITVNSCEFKHINGMSGGVVVVWNGVSGAVHKFENSYFENCTASSSGGALYVHTAIAGNSLEISKCRFVMCKASSGGGALYWKGEIPFSINTVIFKRCQCTDGSCIYWKSNSTSSLRSMCVVECSKPFFGLSYEDSKACSVTDVEWPPTVKFTEHDVRPRYYISGILTQLHATLWLA